MPTFEQQQPLNDLGFCRSAAMEQHVGRKLPQQPGTRPPTPAPPKAKPGVA